MSLCGAAEGARTTANTILPPAGGYRWPHSVLRACTSMRPRPDSASVSAGARTGGSGLLSDTSMTRRPGCSRRVRLMRSARRRSLAGCFGLDALVALVTSSDTSRVAVSMVSGGSCQAVRDAGVWRRAQNGALGNVARSRRETSAGSCLAICVPRSLETSRKGASAGGRRRARGSRWGSCRDRTQRVARIAIVLRQVASVGLGGKSGLGGEDQAPGGGAGDRGAGQQVEFLGIEGDLAVLGDGDLCGDGLDLG